jgi:uncharacterized damage-inducible protein DinB
MTGRPGPNEAAPDYLPYIDLAEGTDILNILSQQLEDATGFFAAISEETSLLSYAPGKWSIRQVLNHVTDTERAFAFRALWFARGFTTPLPGYDQNIAAAAARANTIPWQAHVDEFERVRLATLSLFQNLPEDAWLRTGIANDNPFTVRALAFLIAGHAAHHIAMIRDRYLS